MNSLISISNHSEIYLCVRSKIAFHLLLTATLIGAGDGVEILCWIAYHIENCSLALFLMHKALVDVSSLSTSEL